MISYLRNRIGHKSMVRIFAYFTAFSLAGSMIFYALTRFFAQNKQPNVIETVDGYPITRSDLQRREREFTDQISMIRQQYRGISDMILAQMGLSDENVEAKARALLRQEKVLLSVANQLGFELSPKYVETQLANPGFLASIMSDYVPKKVVSSKGIDFTALAKSLQHQGIAIECFESIAEEKMKATLVIPAALGALYVPQIIVDEQVLGIQASRDITINCLDTDSYISKAHKNFEKMSNDQLTSLLKKYFEEQNKYAHRYFSEEKRQGYVTSFEKVPDYFVSQAESSIGRGKRSFDEFVQRFKGSRSELPLMSLQDAFKKDAKKYANKLFSQSLRMSKPGVFKEGNHGYIVELSKLIPAAPLDFDKIKSRVEKDFYAQEARRLLFDDLNKLKLLTRTEREAWLKKNATESHESHESQVNLKNIIIDDKNSKEKYSEYGLSSETLKALNVVGDRLVTQTKNGGCIAELVAIRQPKEAKKSEEKSLIQNIKMTEQQRVLGGFIASCEKNAKIEGLNSQANSSDMNVMDYM